MERLIEIWGNTIWFGVLDISLSPSRLQAQIGHHLY
jgi:hypothetical protein